MILSEESLFLIKKQMINDDDKIKDKSLTTLTLNKRRDIIISLDNTNNHKQHRIVKVLMKYYRMFSDEEFENSVNICKEFSKYIDILSNYTLSEIIKRYLCKIEDPQSYHSLTLSSGISYSELQKRHNTITSISPTTLTHHPVLTYYYLLTDEEFSKTLNLYKQTISPI